MEPIMAIEVVMPEDYLGSVMGDMTSRRGQIETMESRNEAQVLKAKVPLSSMFGYATELRSMTQGRAVFTMQFSHYENAPNHIQEQIIEKYLGKKSAN
jgi:elongation factor G